MHARFESHQLDFITPATTSRGSMQQHQIYLIHLELQGKVGTGEIAPLPGLSIDANHDELEKQLADICIQLNHGVPLDALRDGFSPAVNFGFETAALHLSSQLAGKSVLYDTPFTRGEFLIPINGLVWMNTVQAMENQAREKIAQGFNVIKFKVGAVNVEEEIRMLERIRKDFSAWKITIRLDANGGLNKDAWLEQLTDFSRFTVHSIEQPLPPGDAEMWQEVIARSPIPIAFDESLIGMNPNAEAMRYLTKAQPQFLILKPTLLGGLAVCDDWISLANRLDIGWWATSALESSIGLNAIAQWVSRYKPTLAQGLGTGQLYRTNFASNLALKPPHLIWKSNSAREAE